MENLTFSFSGTSETSKGQDTFQSSFITNESIPSATVTVVAYGVIGLVIVIGNTLIIIVLSRKRVMRVTTTILVCTLAVVDLCCGLIGAPVLIWEKLAFGTTGVMPCLIMPTIIATIATCSISTMLLIAIERYHAVNRYTQPPMKVTHVITLLICTLIMSIIYGLVKNSLYYRDGMCGSRDSGFFALLPNFIVSSAVAVCVMVAYTKMINRLNSQVHVISTSTIIQQRRRVTRLCMFCFIWYIMCYIPTQIFRLIILGIEQYYDIQVTFVSKYQWMFASLCLLLANSLMNPIIYVIFNNRIR